MSVGFAARSYAGDAEQRLFHLDEVNKKVLSRDSSALVLIANPQTCDAMVSTFQQYSPKVIRRDVGEELPKRLEVLQSQLKQQLMAAQGQGAPAGH